MDALAKLISFYNSCPLDDTYRQVAFNVLKNIYSLPEISSYKMAELCFTAPSTLRRLATKLGYKSYTSFTAELNWSLQNYHFLNVYRPLSIDRQNDPITTLLDYISNIAKATSEAINRAYLTKIVNEIRSYKKIVFFVTVPSYQIQRFETDLLLDGHEVMLYTELHDQMTQVNSLGPDTFAIFIKPEVPVTGNVRKLAQLAKSKGVKNLVIINNRNYTPNEFIDYVLAFDGAASLIDIFAVEMIVASIVTKHQELISMSK